jgi:hypothetical protein
MFHTDGNLRPFIPRHPVQEELDVCRPKSCSDGAKATFEMPMSAIERPRMIDSKKTQYIVELCGYTRWSGGLTESKAACEEELHTVFTWQLALNSDQA